MPLSALHQIRIPDLNSHTPYIPPHPQRGTPYHRYILLLLPQSPLLGSSYTRNAEARAQSGSPTSVHLDIPPLTDAERRRFNVRAFAQQWGLNGAKGGGVHMWRELWSEAVSKIYADILSESLPFRRIWMLIYVSRRGGRAKVWQNTKSGSVRGVKADKTIRVVAAHQVSCLMHTNWNFVTRSPWAQDVESVLLSEIDPPLYIASTILSPPCIPL